VAITYSRVFIAIDALDECQVSDGCRSRFLSEIFNLKKSCHANIFATSRDIPEITQRFDGNVSLEIRARDEDVRKYLEGQILESESMLLKTHHEAIQSAIIKVVDGMYVLLVSIS
jgi:hypothetical protein